MGFETAYHAQAALGECPLWCGQTQRLWWVDIEAPAIHCFDPETGQNQTFALDENVGCIGLRAQGGFIAGLRSGLWLLDAKGRKEKLIANPQEDTRISRFNDGRVDPWGRFWAGTIYEPRDRPAAGLYRVNAALECQPMAGDIKVSNGVAFSPDRRWLYHSDTPAHVIYRYPLDPQTGEIGARTVFHQFPFGNGRPDGAAVDAEGFYWSALYEGARVVRLSPEGEIVAEYPVPARCPTMCAFGGADLRTVYVTSACHGRPPEELADWPESGNLFAMRVDVPGQPEPRFAG
ncbi:SMP-30/gluconolactonase/LRE family protein [Roseinatronobacter monicus]|uniref:SMP-30/gluconolactonase/LRE family protein n=1 Tax=Roseinatronobacter monicus TaxID=393481 RepID=UPI003F3590A7